MPSERVQRKGRCVPDIAPRLPLTNATLFVRRPMARLPSANGSVCKVIILCRT
jgi:hypothetical protein